MRMKQSNIQKIENTILYTHTHTQMCTLCIFAYNKQMTLECMSLVVTDAYNSIQDV